MPEPRQIISGDTTSWTRVQADLPACDGWVLTYYVSTQAEEPKPVVAQAVGPDYQVIITPGWDPGRYHWTARVARGQEVHTVGAGIFDVLPDPSKAYDRRTRLEKLAATLTAVEALVAKRMPDSIVEFEVYEGIKAKHLSHADLLTMRDRLRTELRVARGGPLVRVMPVGRALC